MTSDAAPDIHGPAALRRVVVNAGKLLGGRSVNAVLSLAYLAIAARALGVTAFGVLVLIHAFAQFLGDVVKFQSWQTLIHYGAGPLHQGEKARFQQVLRFTLLLDVGSGIVGLAIGIAGAFLFSGKLGWTPDQAPAAAGYVLSVAFMVSATPLGLLRLFDRFDVLAGQAALVSIVRLAGSAIAWAIGAPLEGYLLAWAVGTAVGFALLVWASVSELGKRGLLAGFSMRGPLADGLPGVWKFAWSTNLNTTLDVAFTHIVTLAVGALVGPAQAGFWRMGRQVADAIAKPAKLLTPALYPELARLRVAQGEAQMAKLALQVGLMTGGFSAVIVTIAAFAGKPLLTLVMGPAFAPAAELMTWQVAAAAIGIFALPLEPMLVSQGRPGAALRVRLVVSLAFLASLALLIDQWGARGAAIGLVAAAAAMALGNLGMLLRRPRGALSQEAACGDSVPGAKDEP
ncbi:lipopolysaccharide biosynthesis protein [Phenylobacterium sp. J367]|uniref:lipopolysaccharide biosynthesis protein n=1 Tax=Phenylobacterium sp. J367 TaxID=2898435 RepID=UPI0021512A35|nr:lipopolysaccharide biosynthesis protein [Phenylobacterium sp. J367]MCR5880410.1 lipopolysaccharide biosynthesis protein [Phenylobacterium sp. J367]